MFQFKRTLLTAVLTLSAVAASYAQTQTLEGVKRVPRSSISPIYAGNEVKGYLMYSEADKADRKNDNYHLDFYDQDLNKVSTVVIQKPAGKYFLLDNAFNGSTFALYFYNHKEKTMEIETYDTNLKKLASKVVGEVNRQQLIAIDFQMRSEGGEGRMPFGGLELRPVADKGFARVNVDGKHYELEMYDNNLQLKWRQKTDPKSKYLETLIISESTNKYMIGTVLRKSGAMSQKLDSYMVAFDLATGKKVLDQAVESSKSEQLSLSSFTYDASNHEFVAVGEYYKPEDKPFVNKSQGFYIKRFGEDGKLVGIKPYNWQKEVKGLMPAEARQGMEDGFMNFTHSILKGANGNTYVVSEQYKIAGKGLDVAMSLMGAGGGGSKGVIGNMVVFVLDPAYKLTDVKCYTKDVSKVILPGGAGFAGAGLLGQYIKAIGGFDYQFMQRSDANSLFNVVYINYDKEKGEATKKIVGNIAFGENGKFAVDKIDGTSTATNSFVYPAKPGYVMMVDYLKKQKQLGMKLVKLNI
ncbi:DUF6770 family protein [Hymenobacter sp.]|jgi:hypothetical protein|uniref:DUF6770 family protein n=1 Tax=Hymenobacter sp. TaxID=1898978 RepID=UPI002ED7F239